MSDVDDLIQQLRSRGKDAPPYPLTKPAYGSGARYWFRQAADALESEHAARQAAEVRTLRLDAEVKKLRTQNRKLMVDGEPHRRSNRRWRHLEAENTALRDVIGKAWLIVEPLRTSPYLTDAGRELFAILAAVPDETKGGH